MINIVSNFCAIALILITIIFTLGKTNKNMRAFRYFISLQYMLIIKMVFSLFYEFIIVKKCSEYYIFIANLILNIMACLIIFCSAIFITLLIPSMTVKSHTFIRASAIITSFFIFLMFTGKYTSLFPYYENGVIIEKPQMAMILLQIFYSSYGLIIILLKWSELNILQKRIMLSIHLIPAIIAGIEVIISIITRIPQKSFSTVGFAYALSIFIVYSLFYSSNYDNFSGYQTYEYFENDVIKMLSKKKNFTIVFLHIKNEELFKNAYEDKQIKLFFSKINKTLKKYNIYNTYCIKPGFYALLIFNANINDLNNLKFLVRDILDVRIKNIQDIKLLFESFAVPCGMYVNTFNELKIIMEYNNFAAQQDIRILNEKDFEAIAFQKKLFSTIAETAKSLGNNIINDDELSSNIVEMYYQPILHNATKTFLSAEALMRLKIPELGGIIYPDKFIPYIEKNDYIHIFSCLALSNVCKFINILELTNKKIEGISVNFSILEFVKPNFETDILKIVERYSINPSKIHIELTETIDDENIELIRAKMLRLKEKGFKFYLDDFGTGYSNFTRLVELPFDVIKFDKSLIDKSLIDNKVENIIQALSTQLADEKTMVLFEGVENSKTEELASKSNVTFSQGWKYAKAMPKEMAIKYFSEQ